MSGIDTILEGQPSSIFNSNSKSGNMWSSIIMMMISYIINDVNKINAEKEDAKNRGFAREEAQKQRDWTEEMYNEHLSREALYESFRGLGASENAALSAALGSPSSIGSGASASNFTPLSSFPQMSGHDMISSLLDSLQSFTQAENTQANTENTIENTKWISPLNSANIKALLGKLDVDRKNLHLNEKIFNEVTKPVAESTINLNLADIQKKHQEVNNLKQELLNRRQQLENLKSQQKLTEQQTVESKARTDLYDAQSVDAYMDAKLKGVQADLYPDVVAGQNVANEARSAEALSHKELLDQQTFETYFINKISSIIGFPLSVPTDPKSLLTKNFYGTFNTSRENPPKPYTSSLDDIINGVDAAYNAAESAIESKAQHYRSKSIFGKFVDQHFESYRRRKQWRDMWTDFENKHVRYK